MIVVDVETGGLDPRQNPLFSIGACDYDTAETFEVNILPVEGTIISQQALEVNGINVDEWLKTARPLKECLSNFNEWMKGRDTMLAGHNPSFDRGFLEYNYNLVGLKNPFGYRTVDLHSWAYLLCKIAGTDPVPKLTSEDVYDLVGMAREPKPHRALHGAVWEALAFAKIEKLVRGAK